MFSPWVKLYRKYCVSKAGNVKWFVYDFLILSELLPPSPSPPSSPPAASDPKCEFRISVGTAGPQLRAPDLSGHCRTSTARPKKHLDPCYHVPVHNGQSEAQE